MAATYANESQLAMPLGPTSASPQQQTQPDEANVKLQTVTPPAYLPSYTPQGGQMVLQSSGGPQAPAVGPMQFGQEVPNQQVLYQVPNQQGAYIATNPQVLYQPPNPQVVYQPPNPQVVYQPPNPQVVYQPPNQQVVYPQGIQNQPVIICQPPIVQGAVTPHPGVAIGESLGLQYKCT